MMLPYIINDILCCLSRTVRWDRDLPHCIPALSRLKHYPNLIEACIRLCTILGFPGRSVGIFINSFFEGSAFWIVNVKYISIHSIITTVFKNANHFKNSSPITYMFLFNRLWFLLWIRPKALFMLIDYQALVANTFFFVSKSVQDGFKALFPC